MPGSEQVSLCSTSLVSSFFKVCSHRVTDLISQSMPVQVLGETLSELVAPCMRLNTLLMYVWLRNLKPPYKRGDEAELGGWYDVKLE